MDILNSGSFVPLDNREKIEKLKFTAKELATEVAKTEGFQNNGPTNQQLALEMWKGAEYMCRAHEENTVRNIFLSSFLEELRELARSAPSQCPSELILNSSDTPFPASAAAAGAAAPSTVPSEPEQAAPSVAVAADEFLGFMPASDNTPPESRQSSYSDECVPEFDADIEAIVDRLESEGSHSGTKSIGSEEVRTTAVADTASEGSEPNTPAATDQAAADEMAETKAPIAETKLRESSESEPVASIVIACKEPYNFDSCTITAVVQILPESTGFRKCVVSVRSHDFAPQITISDLANKSIAEDIKRNLDTAFSQYRMSLPILAAEKIKKEKPASKKRVSKPAEKGKATNAKTESKSSVTAQPGPNSAAEQDQNTLFAS